MFEASSDLSRNGSGDELAHGGGAPAADAVHADRAAAEAVRIGPGPRAVELLDRVDISQLSDAGRLDYLLAWEQLSHWVAARPLPALLDHVGYADVTNGPDMLADLEQASAVTEVSLTLGLSEQALRGRMAVARDLHERLPATAQALRSGHLSFWHARAMSEATAEVRDRASLARIEDRVLSRTVGRPVGQFRRAARASVDLIEPGAAAARHRTANKERHIRRWPLPDGMACLSVEAAAPDIETIWAALTVLAGPSDAADPRPIGARRTDALLGLCLGAVAADPVDDATGPARVVARPRVPVQAHVVVDLPTLLGLADHPCELRGYGPIPAAMARDWLHKATTWRRLVTDPVDGHLLDFGPLVRSAPLKLRDYTTQLHQRCTFPACTRPAGACDLDHQPPWRPDGTGGSTRPRDLRPLCRRHHRFKTHLDWQLDHPSATGSSWRSPSGTTWDVDPPPVLEACS